MLVYGIGSLIGMVIAAWLAAQVVATKHKNVQRMDDIYRRIDDVERNASENVLNVERNLTDMITSVQQELIRENASLITRFKTKA